MAPRHFLLLAFLALVVVSPAAAPGDSSITDQIQSADHQLQSAEGVYSYTYFDPNIISPGCVSPVDPLGCTAEEGAMTLEADALADATAPELTTLDGAVVDPDDSSSTLDSIDIPEPSSTLDPASALDLSAELDSSIGIDPTLQPEEIDPTIEPQEAAAAVAARPMVRGFNTRQEADYLSDGDTRRWDRAWDLIGGTNVRVHRLTVYWWDVQCRGADKWDWTKYVRVAQAAQVRNMRLILTPVGSPNWARNGRRQTPTQTDPPDPCVPTDASGLGIFAHPDTLAAWAEFIHHMAIVFKPFNPIGYEIWNEENSRDFWDRVGIPTRTPQPPCPSCWTRLYCLAAGQIDIHDARKAVGVGGLAAYRQNEFVMVDGRRVMKNMRLSAFLQRAYSAQATICSGKPFDYVGYHPYVYRAYYDGRTPRGGIGNTPAMLELPSVRGVMINHNQAGKRIWNTEWGFPSGRFVDAGTVHTISEARQAYLIKREHDYLAGLKDRSGFPYMRFSILFNPIDSFPNDVFSHIGVVWVNHSNEEAAKNPGLWRKKPSYRTWTSLPQP